MPRHTATVQSIYRVSNRSLHVHRMTMFGYTASIIYNRLVGAANVSLQSVSLNRHL